MNTNKFPWNKFFWSLTIVGLCLGVIGLFDRLSNGHINTNYGSYMPWGLWVAGYIYLIGLSAGAFLMSTLVYVFRIKMLEKIGRIALLTALATLIGALLCIWLDLGHMTRVWRMVVFTNFGSVMGWMSWLYGLYCILLLIEFFIALRANPAKQTEAEYQRDTNLLRVLGGFGIPLAIAFHGSVGAIFGVVGARPYWNSGLTPIVFLIGALTSGGALLAMIIAIWGPGKGSEEHKKIILTIGRIVLALLAFDALLEWAEISIGLWSSLPSESASLRLVLFGHYWWVFWFIHIGLGIIVPGLLLLFKSNSTKVVSIAGALIAITFIAVRLNIVIPALAVPELEGLRHAFTGPGLSFEYFPSVTEWLVFFFTISVGALVFMVAKSVLPVLEESTDAGKNVAEA